jgi:hypothetical protein
VANIFPKWSNKIPTAVAVVTPLVGVVVIAAMSYWFSPMYTDVGYQPKQPVPYSHKLHAGDLNIDCRYCHNTVENADFAALPPTATCMNCHKHIATDSPKLAKVRASAETGESIKWVKIHQLPDYAYFSHQVHVNAGVGCVSCHGRVDQMEEVYLAKPLSMSWCLDCHRNPAPNLRPLDQVTNMAWDREKEGYDAENHVNRAGRPVQPPVHCSGCHR